MDHEDERLAAIKERLIDPTIDRKVFDKLLAQYKQLIAEVE